MKKEIAWGKTKLKTNLNSIRGAIKQHWQNHDVRKKSGSAKTTAGRGLKNKTAIQHK